MTDPIDITGVAGESCKLITCVMVDSDNRADLDLLKALRAEQGVIRASTSPCLSSSLLAEAKAKPGKLPEPAMARYVEILVGAAEADSVFEFVCQNVHIDHLGGGAVMQMPAPFGTLYSLPEGVPDEPGES
jgi:hypothetical protein